MKHISIIDSSEAAIAPQTEPKRWQGIGSIIWGVVSLLLTALQSPVTEGAAFKVLESLSDSPNYIATARLFLLSSVITAVLAIRMGLRERRTRLDCIGLLLGVISVVGIAVWEVWGGWFCLFWAP